MLKFVFQLVLTGKKIRKVPSNEPIGSTLFKLSIHLAIDDLVVRN